MNAVPMIEGDIEGGSQQEGAVVMAMMRWKLDFLLIFFSFSFTD